MEIVLLHFYTSTFQGMSLLTFALFPGQLLLFSLCKMYLFLSVKHGCTVKLTLLNFKENLKIVKY